MIRLKPFYALLLFLCLSFSCHKEQEATPRNQLAWEDFKSFLTADTDYQAIVAKFGMPDRDIGSGIHIYVYDLKDSTEMWIGYVGRILYARHMDKYRNILHTVI